MCGRFTQYSDISTYAEYLDAEVGSQTEYTPHYNVAPTQSIWAARLSTEGQRELVTLRWGLVPHWSKGIDNRYSMINARAETVHEKPAYRDAFKRRRCLIPANGFYEWQQADGKQPYYIKRTDDEPFAFAGIWEHWEGEGGEVIESCSIIVTEANDLLAKIHDRMPVILPKKAFGKWLDPDQSHPNQRNLLKPFPSVFMTMYPVSRTVNTPKNDKPDLIQPSG